MFYISLPLVTVLYLLDVCITIPFLPRCLPLEFLVGFLLGLLLCLVLL